MSGPRDPRINDHSPAELRRFAANFRQLAARHRSESDRLEAKALRYLAKANEKEKAQ